MTTGSAIAGTTGDAAISTERTRRGVPRRTLVAGTAWAVPAVIVAAAAPAVAASSSACPKLVGAQGSYSSAIADLTLTFDVLDPGYVLVPTSISPSTGGFVLPPPKNFTVNNAAGYASVTYTWARTGTRQNRTLTFKLTKGDVVCTSDLYSVTFFA